MDNILGKLSSSPKADECYTPAYAVRPVIKHLEDNGFVDILCPFDTNESEYVQVLLDYGFVPTFSHIKNGADFFDITEEDVKDIDCIVSNPPYSVKDKVLEKLYSLNKPFMMLLPVTATVGKKRVDMYMKNGVEFLMFDKRIGFITPGNKEVQERPHSATCYICWNVLDKPLVLERLVK